MTRKKINLCRSQGDTDIRVKDINAATRSVFQKVRVNTLETKKMIRSLSKDIKSIQIEILELKNIIAEIKIKTHWLCSLADLKLPRGEPMILNIDFEISNLKKEGKRFK